MNCINAISIQDLHQVLGQSVEVVQHLQANPHFITTAMVMDCNLLKQQCNQEQTIKHIAQNLATLYKTKIQQLQIWNLEAIAEFNAYQDRITTLQKELNYKCTNAEALHAVAAAAGTSLRQ
jgi:hypothetical protein